MILKNNFYKVKKVDNSRISLLKDSFCLFILSRGLKTFVPNTSSHSNQTKFVFLTEFEFQIESIFRIKSIFRTELLFRTELFFRKFITYLKMCFLPFIFNKKNKVIKEKYSL